MAATALPTLAMSLNGFGGLLGENTSSFPLRTGRERERERVFKRQNRLVQGLCSYYPAGSRALMSLTPTDFCRNTVYACSKHRSLHASSKEAQLTGSHKTYGICFTSFPFTFPFRFVYEILQRAHLLWTPTVTSFYGGVACINHALCIASDLLLVRSSLLLARAREDNLRMR